MAAVDRIRLEFVRLGMDFVPAHGDLKMVNRRPW